MARNLNINSIAGAASQADTAIQSAAAAAASITTTPTNGAIFKRFDIAGGDVLPSVREIESATCWDDPNGILVGGEMNVSSTGVNEVARSSSLYYVNVYQNITEAASGSDAHFAIAFGHRLGSGSGTVSQGGYTGNLQDLTPSKAIYSQYRNLLLQPGDQIFNFGTTGSNSIFVINFNRARYKEKLDPGNWQLALSDSVSRTYIDNSGAGTDPSVNAAGRVFKIVSGSILNGTSSDATVYGLAYPDVGILVFHPQALVEAGVIAATMNDINASPTTTTWSTGNIKKFHDAMVDGDSFQARTEENVTSTYYFIRVRNNEFNYSNNPSFTTGSVGLVRYGLFQNDPRVYITGVGLYDNNNQLLAIAKLSRPLLKTFTRECLIRVRLTY